jgi:Putative DNA-binding domain
VIDLFHGRRLQQIELSDVEALLDDTRAEPLHWEAKGIKIEPGEVRKQICGFANSHDGGYLILGTDVRDGDWALDGVEFRNDDPPAWISEVAEGVQPYPEGLDTRPIKIQDRRWIAVAWVPPTPTPPCNAHGTVYERVSGRTVSVREPLRLAQLFGRGDQAHDSARAGAQWASQRVREFAATRWPPVRNVTFALGLRAVGYEPDISRSLFAPKMIELLLEIVPGGTNNFIIEHRQDAVVGWTLEEPKFIGQGEWFVRAAWDGSIGVACRLVQVDTSQPDSLVHGPIRQAWKIASGVVDQLAPVGPAYLRVSVDGRQFDPRDDERLVHTPCQLDRGPIGRGVDDELLPGIEREIRRHMRERAFEGEA